VSGVKVEIAYFDASNTLLDWNAGYTDGGGIAILSFDTGASFVGSSDWLDVNLSGSYVGGTAIVPSSGGACDGDVKEINTSADVFATSGTSGSSGPSYPTHYQEHNLSCEYASLQIATTALGAGVSEDNFLYDTPNAVDPHYGFRGDIDGPFGSTDDYGVYAEALVQPLADYGFNGSVWYDPSAGALESELDAGHPTLVWISTRGDTGWYDEDANGNRFKLVPWEHVVVAFSYDSDGVYVSDPGNGSIEHLSWGWFLDAWGVMNGMALTVSW